MKRLHAPSAAPLIMKETKVEIEDDPDDFKYANQLEFLVRVPKKERDSPEAVLKKIIKKEIPDEEEYDSSSFMMTDAIPEEFFNYSAKEEVSDDDHHWIDVKTESDQLIKEEPEPEPLNSVSEIGSALIWKPDISSLSDFTSFNDLDDSELDLGLGSSILFDKDKPERYLEVPEEKRHRSVTPINFEDEYDPNFRENHESLMPKRQLPSFKIKKILSENFEKNSHPNAMEMIKMSEKCGVRYRTVFEDFENRRISKKITCEKDDACSKIRSFFLRDGENMLYNRVNLIVKQIMEEEIKTHVLSRKRFSLGYVHVIMEKTNLPPAYIRGQYEIYKKKMFSKEREDYKHNVWNSADCEAVNSLSLDVLRKLEDAYLTKKYQCEETEWSPKDFKCLAAQLEIEENTVAAWMEKRRNAMLGINHVVEQKKEKLARMKMPDGRNLPTQITESLNAEYERNNRPSVTRRVIIAKKLNLTEMQVRNFFNKKRIQTRRHAEWETARQDVIKMPREKVQQMEKIAAEKRKPADEYMQDAIKIGVEYMTLISFVNWRKSVVASKLSNFKYQSSANHKY